MGKDPYDGRKPGMFRNWMEAAPFIIFGAIFWIGFYFGIAALIAAIF